MWNKMTFYREESEELDQEEKDKVKAPKPEIEIYIHTASLSEKDEYNQQTIEVIEIHKYTSASKIMMEVKL